MDLPEHSIHYLEIVTPDAEATCQHYSKAYGWHFEPAGPDLGFSYVARLPGGSLCGIRAPLHAEEMPILRTYPGRSHCPRKEARVGAFGARAKV